MVEKMELKNEIITLKRIIDESLVAYLYDNTDAWELQIDGSYQRQQPLDAQPLLSAQIELMNKYQQKN